MSTRVRASGSVNYIRNSFTINSLELVLRDDAGNPAPANPGEALIGLWAVDKDSGAFNPPEGWTVLANRPGADTSLLLCGKIAVGGETSVTASWTTVNEGASGVITARAPSTPGAVLSFGPVHHPAYVATNRTSMALGPLTADAGIEMADAVSFFTIDSIGDTAGTASRFAPTATGWTHAVTATAGGTGTGTPAAAITDRNTGVGPGATVPSTTFSWVNSDQTQGAMVLVYETASTEPPTDPEPPAATTPTLTYRLSGIARPTSVAMTTKTENATSVRIRATDVVTQVVITSPPVTPDTQGLAKHAVSGLTPGADYTYRVLMTDTNGIETADIKTDVGKFRAAPEGPTSFAFSFGSCSYDGMGDINASARAIAARGDDFFLFLGDPYDYDGSGDSLTNFRAKMDARITTPGFAELFAAMGMTLTPSDHDLMNNDATAASHPTAAANWKTAYGERFPNALPDDFMWGRVHFIVLDCRTRRGASGTTLLGAEQKQWLKDTITASTAAAIVLVQDGIWIGSANADTWHLYPAEQTELANHFAASGKNIVMLGGDMHAVAADDGTNSPGGIAVFQAAPLNGAASRKGGPYSVAPYPASGSTVVQQHGRIAVNDTGSSISLAFTGLSADGTVRASHTEVYSGPSVDRTITGFGTLTATTSQPRISRNAALPGTGTVTAGVTQPRISRNASLSGSGSLTATAVSAGQASVNVALSGSGSLTAALSAARVTVTAPVISGTGTLTATSENTGPRAVNAVLTGTGSLSAVVASSHVTLSLPAIGGSSRLTVTVIGPTEYVVWIAERPLFLGDGAGFVRAFNPGEVVPLSVAQEHLSRFGDGIARRTISD